MSTDITINDQLKNDSSTYATNIMQQYESSINEYKKMINKGTLCWSKKKLHKYIYDIFDLILNSKTKYTPVLDTLKKVFGITISRYSDDTFTFKPMEIKRILNPGDPVPVIWNNINDQLKKEFLLIFRWIYEKTCNILFLHKVLPNETIDNLIRDLCNKIANDFMDKWVPSRNLDSYKRNVLKILEIPRNDPTANSLASIDDVNNVDQIITAATTPAATTPAATTPATITTTGTVAGTVAGTASTRGTVAGTIVNPATSRAGTVAGTVAGTAGTASTRGTVAGRLGSNVIRRFDPNRGFQPDHSNKVKAISDFNATQGPQDPDPNIRIKYLTIKKDDIIFVKRRENEWMYGIKKTMGHDEAGSYINREDEGYFPTDFVELYGRAQGKTKGGKKNKKSKKVKLKNKKSKKRKTYKKRNN